MARIDLFDLHLHREQLQQVVALVGLVHALHQRGLAFALGGIWLAIGMQRTRQAAEDVAHRLARFAGRVNAFRALAARASRFRPPPPFFGPRLELGVESLARMFDQLVDVLRLVTGNNVFAEHLAKHCLGHVQLGPQKIPVPHAAVPLENGFDLAVGPGLQHGLGQSDDDIAQLGPPGTCQPVTFRRAGEEPVDEQHGRPLLGQQLALQRLDFGRGATPVPVQRMLPGSLLGAQRLQPLRELVTSWLNKRWFLLSALAADLMRIRGAAPGSPNRPRCAAGILITPTQSSVSAITF